MGARRARPRLRRTARPADDVAHGVAAAHIARKRFGQHFLVEPAVIDAIVRAVDPCPGDAIVEIGPGLGAITRPLLEGAGRLAVVELDRDLAARLRGWPGLDVVEADVLRVDFAAMATAAGAKLRIVGNLPYNISTPILFHLLDAAGHVVDQHVMLQQEVVDRIVARPSTKAYGRLSVMLQWRYETERVLGIGAEAFDPPPRVKSAVLRMTPLAEPPDIDAALLGEIVTVGFSQRRKLLRHTLGRWLDARGSSADFNVQRRAEEVPVAEWIELTRSELRQPRPG